MSHTDTSRAALDSVSQTKEAFKDGIVQALAAFGVAGLTADEIAKLMDASVLYVRPRVTELGQEGRINKTERRRPNASGRSAIVWVAA